MIEIKKEIKQNKINTSMRLKAETILRLDKISNILKISNSSIIDQLVEKSIIKGIDNVWKRVFVRSTL